MKTKLSSTVLLGSAVAFGVCALTSCNSKPVPEVPQIKKVVNDFEKTPDAFPFWPGEQSGMKCNAQNGAGYKQSRALHLTYPKVFQIGPDAKVLYNAPALDTSEADGFMFWISTPKAIGVSMAADSKDVTGRYNLGDGVLVMDEKCQFLDPQKYLTKAPNGQRTVSLDAGFKGWIIVPNTLSKDGTNAGWMHTDTSKGKVSNLGGLLIWTGGGEFDIDMLSLYQKKP
ncbi:MAG: hypothetical protein ACKOLA_02475 [Spartobacteria bacterium]